MHDCGWKGDCCNTSVGLCSWCASFEKIYSFDEKRFTTKNNIFYHLHVYKILVKTFIFYTNYGTYNQWDEVTNLLFRLLK